MIYFLSIIAVNSIIERSTPCRKSAKKLALLARNLIFKTCANTIDFIKNIIASPDFIARHRQSNKDFTRNRKLPFHILIAFLLNFVRGSYQDELDKFFKTIHRFDVAKRIVSKAALTKARMKLKFDAFVELNLHLIHYFEKHFSPRTWYGFRLLAIDGSTTRLPMTEGIARHFGVWNCRQGKPSPMGRISQLFDVLNKVTIDALIHPKGMGERELASQHLLNLMPNEPDPVRPGLSCMVALWPDPLNGRSFLRTRFMHQMESRPQVFLFRSVGKSYQAAGSCRFHIPMQANGAGDDRPYATLNSC